MRREDDFTLRHCGCQRSNPGRLARKLDCFVASLLAMTRAGKAEVGLRTNPSEGFRRAAKPSGKAPSSDLLPARGGMRREHDFIFPPPRGARGRGTTRSVVEGACGSSACSNGQKKHHRPRPSHRPNARLPSPLRGAG